MSVVILQFIIKQWDKSQRTEAHVSERASRPDRYPVKVPPAIYIADRQCLIDQHGDDIQGDRIKYSQQAAGKLKLDRFHIDLDKRTLEYCVASETNEERETIASFENNWIQCRYNWRYSIVENDMFYWLYEDITLNAISIDSLNEDVFLNGEPTFVYEDLKLDRFPAA